MRSFCTKSFWSGVKLVKVTRKCFSRRLINGMGKLLYTTSFSAITINLIKGEWLKIQSDENNTLRLYMFLHWHRVCEGTRRNEDDDENGKGEGSSLKRNPGNGCEGDYNVGSTSTLIMLSIWPLTVDRYTSSRKLLWQNRITIYKPHHYSVNKKNLLFDPRRITSNEMALTAKPQ